MKHEADLPIQMDHADKVASCPRCQGAAVLLTPLKSVDKRAAVYGCNACGFSFRADGGAYLENADQLRDVFRGGTLAHDTLTSALKGEKLNAATQALLSAQLLEYGVQMWFDGLKQGLMLGAIGAERGTNGANKTSDHAAD